MRTAPRFIRLTVFVFVLLAGLPLLAQPTACADPFGGAALRFDPADWPRTDFCRAIAGLDWTTIRSGGVPPDGIPAIDFPRFESAAQAADWLEPQSPVLAVVIDGAARAYPLAILIWHEVVNDVLNDVPIAVTFCPLCNTGLVFDRRLTIDGQTVVLDFGVTGNLRSSNLILYDRQTASWWQQFTGESLVGAYAGQRLTVLPSRIIGFGEFTARYPDGEILSRDTGFMRQYGVNPYISYERNQPFLFDGPADPRLPTMDYVLAGLIGPEAEPVAYPFTLLSERRVINDEVGGLPVVAFWQPGTVSALDEPNINASRDLGSAALYARRLGERVLTFSVDETGSIRDAETGSTWNLWGEAIAGDLAGQALEPVIAAQHFWFVWAAFYPETRIYAEES
jgi:hypothetical protein